MKTAALLIAILTLAACGYGYGYGPGPGATNYAPSAVAPSGARACAWTGTEAYSPSQYACN